MIMQNPPSTGEVPDELLRLVTGIVYEAIQADAKEIPQVLSRILEAAHLLIGPEPRTVCLLDYIFDERSVLEDISLGVVRQNISGITGFSLADEFFSSLPTPISQEVSSFRREDGTSLITVPLIANARQVGLLCLILHCQSTDLSNGQQRLLQTLGGLAAITIDRRRSQRNSLRLREWLDTFWEVFAASQVTGTYEDVNQFLRVIADTARKISSADLVVLSECLEEQGDVRVPPVLSGQLIRGNVGTLMHQKFIAHFLDLKQPFFADDASSEWLDEGGLIDSAGPSGELAFIRREEIVSSAVIPLRVDGERIGILFLHYRVPQIFSSDFQEQLRLFANHAALAIANTRRLLRIQRYSNNLEALNRIGRVLNSSVNLSIDQISQLIDQQIQGVISASNFFLCLYDAEADVFKVPYLRDEHETVSTLEPKLHRGLAAYVCRSGKTMLKVRAQQEHLFADGEAEIEGRPSAAWLGAPLVIRDRVIGALVVQDYKNEAAFDEEDGQLLSAIASTVATVIDNYRLLHEANLRLRELEALLNASQAVGAGHTSGELFSSILDHICEIATCDGALLLLADLRCLKVIACSAQMKRHIGQNIYKEGLSCHVVEAGTAMIINNYAGWPDRLLVLDPVPARACAAPLLWHSQVIGTIEIFSSKEGNEFSRREIEILQRFAGPIAAEVQAARQSSFRNAIVHAGPDAIVGVDRVGKIITFNEEAAHLFKYSSDVVLGKNVTQLYWTGLDDARKIQEMLLKFNVIRDQEIFGCSKNGEKIPMSLSAALLHDDQGQVLGSVGIIQDLRLQSLAGRTKLLVEGLREISREEDLDRIAELIVFYAVGLLYADAGCLFLQEAESLELYSWYGADSTRLDDLRTGNARERLATWISRDFREIDFLPQQNSAENLLRPDSRSAVLVPIRAGERLLGLLLIESREAEHFKDEVTLIEILAAQAAVSINRIQLLRYREETQRGLLVRANAVAVGQIAASFIHEAKNSLNGMTLTIHNLIEDINLEPDLKSKNEYKERLSVILSEMQRVDDLSRRLQRFTQQGLRPEKREVYLNEIVTSALRLLDSVLRNKQVRVELRLDSSLSRPEGNERSHALLLDASQLQQVIINLVLNAVGASPARRPLVIETRSKNGSAEIRITDHGTGISEENRHHLFRPFFTTKDNGVGLGLYLSKFLIEDNHGGTIGIERTSPGKGTTFSIHLPGAAGLSGKA